MRVGIPIADDKGLDSMVFEHFGHAPYYLIVEIDDEEIKDVNVIENIYSREHGPGLVPKFLADNGVQVLICRGIGPRAIEFFESFGIHVIRGAYGRVRDVLEKYLEGSLESFEYLPERKWHDETHGY
jgi:predicted Fe-Mo cluster-binding NifX family protein